MAIHLKAARVNAGFTQDQVIEKLKISKSTLIGYELYRRKPDVLMAQKLASLYGLSVDNIIWSA